MAVAEPVARSRLQSLGPGSRSLPTTSVVVTPESDIFDVLKKIDDGAIPDSSSVFQKIFFEQAFTRKYINNDGTVSTMKTGGCGEYTPLQWIYRFAKNPKILLTHIDALTKGLPILIGKKIISERTTCEPKAFYNDNYVDLNQLLSFNKAKDKKFKVIYVDKTPDVTPGYNCLEHIFLKLIEKAGFKEMHKLESYKYLSVVFASIVPLLTSDSYRSDLNVLNTDDREKLDIFEELLEKRKNIKALVEFINTNFVGPVPGVIKSAPAATVVASTPRETIFDKLKRLNKLTYKDDISVFKGFENKLRGLFTTAYSEGLVEDDSTPLEWIVHNSTRPDLLLEVFDGNITPAMLDHNLLALLKENKMASNDTNAKTRNILLYKMGISPTIAVQLQIGGARRATRRGRKARRSNKTNKRSKTKKTNRKTRNRSHQ